MTELSVNEDSSKFVISNTMPAILEKYRDRIEATIKPYLTLNLVENENLTRWQSKCAGWENSSGNFPYLPKGFDYPQTADGEYLHLFMQINCAEIPHLPGFPKQGILQFYLLGNNDQNLYSFGEQYWQQNYELLSPQSKWKVLYFPEPDFNPENLTTNFDFLLE
ncbi:MAG: YwqG family protein, partial [Cyanobacteriota bacterium]|nr:YwqG family protein [Cyanobacteriota bacterium]